MYSQERKFVLTANDQMQILEEIWGAEPQENTDVADLQNVQERTITALHSIKFAANSVQARGVYRAANFCETIFTNFDKKCGPRLRGSLAGLKSLIFQYADGLFEIDPEFKVEIQNRNPLQEIHLENTTNSADHNDNLQTVCLRAKHTQAGHVLKPLLSLVKNDNRRQALDALITFDENTLQKKPIILAQSPTHIAVKFENLMVPITNLVLNTARYGNKQVSISYAADFDDLGLSMANRVQEFLEILCLNIVESGVPTYKSTQISLTGQARESQYLFSINWRGEAIQENSIGNADYQRGLSKLRNEGGDIVFRNLSLKPLGQTSDMQTLEVYFPRKQAKRKAPNTIFALKSEDISEVSQGATG